MKLEKNGQGYYRVILPTGRVMRDEDLMLLLSSNHRSVEMLYASEDSAREGYANYVRLRSMWNVDKSVDVTVTDDWEDV